MFVCVGLLLLAATDASGQTKRINENQISKENVLEDIDEYGRGINKNHVDPFTLIKKKDFFDEIENIKRSVVSCDADELVVKWLQLNAKIGDGHTVVQLQSKDFFPLAIYWYAEGLYVVATNDESRKCYHGRVVAVNGIPVDEVVRRITTVIPDTTASCVKQRLPGMIVDPVLLHGLHISSERSNVTYTLLTPGNDTIKVSPVAIDIRDRNQLTGLKSDKFLRSVIRGKYWFKYFDSLRTIYFNYSSCVDDGNFQHVADELKKTIEQKDPKKIVIDMRYNGGGNSALLQPFIDYISRSQINRNGIVYVLVGRKTYSSAVINAAAFRRQTNAIFVGEETGGTVAHFGETKFFTLPATGVRVYYSTKYFDNYGVQKGPVIPDIRMSEKFAVYENNIDAVIDYAMAPVK